MQMHQTLSTCLSHSSSESSFETFMEDDKLSSSLSLSHDEVFAFRMFFRLLALSVDFFPMFEALFDAFGISSSESDKRR